MCNIKNSYLNISVFIFAFITTLQRASAEDIYSMSENSYIKQHVFDKIFAMKSENPYSPIFAVFSMALLHVAGILVAYTLLAGTASTAHDGEMLGKKWSSMWLPIRLAIGSAALMPTMQGFSIGQAIVIWMLSQGVGLADNIWSAYATNMLKTPSYISADNNQQVREAAQRMLINAGCVEIYNREQRKNVSQDKYASSGGNWQSAVAMSYTANDGAIVGWNYGIADDGGFFNSTSKQKMCGSVFIDMSASKDAVADAVASGSSSNLIDASAIYNAVQPKQIEATKQMIKDINAYAKELIANQPYPSLNIKSSDVNDKLETLVKNYQATVHAASKEAYASAVNQEAVQNTIDKGFAYIGTYWLQFTKAAATINSIENNVAVNGTIPFAASMKQDSSDGFMSDSIFSTGTGSSSVGKQVNDLAMIVKGADSYNEYAAAAMDNDNFFTKTFAWAAKTIFSKDMTSVDPQTMLTHIGMTAENIGVGGGIAVGSANLAASIPFLGNAVTSTAAMFGMMFSGLVVAFMACGAWLHVYLPMMPYLAWLSVYGSIITMGIEAMCCVQVWLVTHLAPDADDFVGKQGQGYMMVFNLFLTPAFNVIGLISSHVVSNEVYGLLNDTFYIAAAGVPGGGIHGMVSNVALMIIYVATATAITQTSVSMITEIPRIAMTWIGGTGGAIMQNMFNAEMSKSNAGTHAAIGALTGALGGMMGRPHSMQNDGKGGPRHNPINTGDLDANSVSKSDSHEKSGGNADLINNSTSDKNTSDEDHSSNQKGKDSGKDLGSL